MNEKSEIHIPYNHKNKAERLLQILDKHRWFKESILCNLNKRARERHRARERERERDTHTHTEMAMVTGSETEVWQVVGSLR